VIEASVLDALRAVAHRACEGRPPAHDALHVGRVEGLARRIAEAEHGARIDVRVDVRIDERVDVRIDVRVDVVRAAALLHELVNLPKHHPDSARSGDLCAEEAARVLDAAGVSASDRDHVVACIRDHAFSKGARPASVEAAVLQDADRLDAIGAIGVARCFATCSEMARPFYEPLDPFAHRRPVDDKQFGLDHFFRKLLRIEAGLHTETARALAAPRTAFLRAFLAQLETEL
jgi:uncharacterized protein